MVVSRFARLKTCTKAGDHGVTGSARCNKCRSGFIRDAPRGRRSITQALQISWRTNRQALKSRLVAGVLLLYLIDFIRFYIYKLL
jgi:uncharacterized membrane protein YvbJ